MERHRPFPDARLELKNNRQRSAGRRDVAQATSCVADFGVSPTPEFTTHETTVRRPALRSPHLYEGRKGNAGAPAP